ncbi:MAG TPA: phosphate/phosphite/phosphonate ABC transporter substrate-binding protein [Moraxellaceae bacterium]
MRLAFSRLLLTLAALLCLQGGLLLGGLAPAMAAGAEYSVAVLPFIPPSEIKRRWQPVLDQINRDTGLRLHFRYYDDNQEFERDLVQGRADFAVMTPLQTWLLRQQYRPLLRNTQPLVGLVVVRNDSKIKQLADLHERKVGLQEGENQPSSMLIRRALREQKIEPDLQFMRSETNALRSVVLGKTDAAIANNYVLRFLPLEIGRQLRVVYSASEMPPPPFTASQKLPAEDVAKVKAAVLAFRSSHPELLEATLMPDVTEADLERDYAAMAKLLAGEKP